MVVLLSGLRRALSRPQGCLRVNPHTRRLARLSLACQSIQQTYARLPRQSAEVRKARPSYDFGFSAAGSAGWDAAGLAIDSRGRAAADGSPLRCAPSAFMNGGGCAASLVNQWKRLRRSEYQGDRKGDSSMGTRAAGPAGPWEGSRRVLGDADARRRAWPPGAPRSPPVSPQSGGVARTWARVPERYRFVTYRTVVCRALCAARLSAD